MGILEMDFERILGVPFFHSSFHSIMLWPVCPAKIKFENQFCETDMLKNQVQIDKGSANVGLISEVSLTSLPYTKARR